MTRLIKAKTMLENAPTSENLASSLRAMLDCYWGEGDGWCGRPPKFIALAKRRLAAFERSTKTR